MPIKVSANGKKFTFPDGTSQVDIGNAIDEYFSNQQQQQQPQRPKETNQQQAGVPPATPDDEPGIFGRIANSVFGFDRGTSESKAASELIDAPIKDIGLKIGLNLATNFDSAEIEKIVRSEFGDNAIRKDDKGNTFVSINGNDYILNKPGLSKQDLGAAIGNILSFLPVSKVASFGQTALRRLGLAAAGSGATQTAIETMQAATGGDVKSDDVENIAIATLLGPVGELPSALKQAKRLTGSAADLLPDVTPAQAAEALAIKESIGVSLLPSQASKTQKDQLINFLLLQDPATSAAMGERLSKQSKDVFDAAFAMLDELANSDDAARAALDVKNASKDAIKNAEAIRAEQTTPLFNKVWKEASANNTVIDTTDVIRSIEDIKGNAIGSQAIREADDIINMIKRATVDRNGSNVERAHNLKRALFQKRDQLKAKNNGFLDDEVKSLYKDAWAMVREKLINEVPGYAEANNLYRNLSPAVDMIDGNLGNIASISEEKLSQVSKSIFNIDEFIANPERFNNTKRLIQNTNSDAWNALVRSRFQQDLAEIGIESAEEALDPNVNFVQQMWQKAFRGKEKTLFKSALDGEMKNNYEAMADVFNRTRKRPAQSATEQLSKLRESLSGQLGVAKAIDAIQNRNSAGIFARLFDSPQSREKNLKIIASVITDPKWMERMTEIRKIGMDTPKGGSAFIQLFKDALNDENSEQ